MPTEARYTSAATETVLASAARTASGNSAVLAGSWGAVTTIRAQLNVTAASGTTPTLDVVLQDSLDGTNWNTVGTFTQATAVTRQVVNVTTPFSTQLRVSWTVAGTTPSFTFDVIAYTE